MQFLTFLRPCYVNYSSFHGTIMTCAVNLFKKWRQPCLKFLVMHFFATFRNYPIWSFEKLPKSYTDSVFLTVDRVGLRPLVTPVVEVEDWPLQSGTDSEPIQMSDTSNITQILVVASTKIVFTLNRSDKIPREVRTFK